MCQHTRRPYTEKRENFAAYGALFSVSPQSWRTAKAVFFLFLNIFRRIPSGLRRWNSVLPVVEESAPRRLFLPHAPFVQQKTKGVFRLPEHSENASRLSDQGEKTIRFTLEKKQIENIIFSLCRNKPAPLCLPFLTAGFYWTVCGSQAVTAVR